jgi:hypothetical protein
MAASNQLIVPHLLSHGTVECADIAATRRFLEEFLGIDVIRPLPEAQYMWKGGPWTVVCVCVHEEGKDQGPENHFELSVASAAEVAAAHDAAVAQRETYGIRDIQPVKQTDGVSWFLLQDLDKTWWKISDASQSSMDEIFARGDIAA